MNMDPAPAERRAGILHHPGWRLLARKDVLAGLMFMGTALFGLVASRKYPVGDALRMGTGYVPRFLCWVLLGLGACVLLQGFRAGSAELAPSEGVTAWRPAVLVTSSLVVFGLTLERLGLVVSVLLLIGIGALAARSLRLVETLAAAIVLVALSWAIFIVGLGLTIPVWPEW
jgi:putative tricarboxylic transport membrane protein